MKTIIKQIQKKTIEELNREVKNLQEEIARLQLELKVNLPKDTNILIKKRKQLARILTVLNEKLEVKKLIPNETKSNLIKTKG